MAPPPPPWRWLGMAPAFGDKHVSMTRGNGKENILKFHCRKFVFGRNFDRSAVPNRPDILPSLLLKHFRRAEVVSMAQLREGRPG